MSTFFDPIDFIEAPFWKCPNCGTEDSFGVLDIRENFYIRRCKICRFRKSYLLPKINKKVIYIDQFAISNMMKALNPHTKAYQRGTLDVFWVEMFETLDTTCKLQLVVCPDSIFHKDESLLSPFYDSLKRMYELLSHGITFYDGQTIKRFQMCKHARLWFVGNGDKQISLDRNQIVYGKINEWQSRFIISTNLTMEDIIEDLRRARDTVNEQIEEIFKCWQSDEIKKFDDWFQYEVMSYGKSILDSYQDYLRKCDRFCAGTNFDIKSVFPTFPIILICSLNEVFVKEGLNKEQAQRKTVEYLLSPYMQYLPFLKIASLLYAALARKAASGQKRPPTQGMMTDIEIVSTLLPYCDAMFIDNECHGLLRENPLCDEINYDTRIFSLNTKENFLQYLYDIKLDASPEHLEKVFEVYGKEWGQPYNSLYGNE